jgi:hypothetical protein
MLPAWVSPPAPPHAAVACESGLLAMRYWFESCSFSFTADGKDIFALARSTEHSLQICHIVVRLLAVSVVHSLLIERWGCPDGSFIKMLQLWSI